jgi:hypothetical protein
VVAALGLAVAALGYVTTTEWARETARRTGDRLEEHGPRPGADAKLAVLTR